MIIGNTKELDKKFNFRVQIDGFINAGFMKCSELSVETSVIENREGGGIFATKSAGLAKVADVTLERGACFDPQMLQWCEETSSGVANRGLVEQAYKRHLDIIQFNRMGIPIKRYSLFNAFPSKFVAGSWDNSADENVVESLTLAFEYFIRTL